MTTALSPLAGRLLCPTCMFCFQGNAKEIIKGVDGENLGKPSQPEASSLNGQIGSPSSSSMPRISEAVSGAREPAYTRSVDEGIGSGNQSPS